MHALLGLGTQRDLLTHPLVGGSGEGLVIENRLACAPPNTQAHCYKTAVGAEIDLLLNLPAGALWAIEIMRSSAPTASKGHHIARDNVSATCHLPPGGQEVVINARADKLLAREEIWVRKGVEACRTHALGLSSRSAQIDDELMAALERWEVLGKPA